MRIEVYSCSINPVPSTGVMNVTDARTGVVRLKSLIRKCRFQSVHNSTARASLWMPLPFGQSRSGYDKNVGT